MSLLQNEEFAIYQLRTGYLANIKDGVGERLINVNSSIINSPAFRAAGWVINPADVRRTYSPPIPTAGVSEYFRAPVRQAGLSATELGDEEDEGGMVTGGGSNETVGPATTIKRRRRREQLDEDDSSDLSDESDDEPEATAAQQIKFAKLPVRRRTESSPPRPSKPLEGPALMITSATKPPDHDDGRLAGGPGSALNLTKSRLRRDTTTSSELSSDLGLVSSVLGRRQTSPERAAQAGQLLIQKVQDDDDGVISNRLLSLGREEVGSDSDDSTLSSELVGSVDSESIMPIARQPSSSSPIANMQRYRPPNPLINTSPKKSRQPPSTLQALPPPRPISLVQPVSALAMAIRAKNKKPVSPLERFAALSGRGDPNPLYIKIYAPFATNTKKPLEMVLRRNATQGVQVTVADAIGFSLFRYTEEKLEPPIASDKMNVNRWTLRMVEDEEVDYDFPALSRTRPIIDFTSNNNRPSRGRSRDMPWDEFALVEATNEQLEENERLTPMFSQEAAAAQETIGDDPASAAVKTPVQTATAASAFKSHQNPITGTNFGPAPVRKDTNLLDTPTSATPHATPRTGAPKTLKIHFTDGDFRRTILTTEVTTDTYIAEIYDQVCKKLNLDKAVYMLKVSGTNTVAPPDRTVESMGDRSDLDLTRRRFLGEGTFGISGSPGSSSPNTPLMPTPNPGTPKKQKKSLQTIRPLSSKQDLVTATNTNSTYKRYNVIRKQPMSFSSSHQRILAIDGEYIHIMPPDTGRTLFDAATKTTTIPFSSVVGCKVSRRHPKTFRVVVFKERESKRYDFEAVNAAEANQIVEEIKRGVEPFQDPLA